MKMPQIEATFGLVLRGPFKAEEYEAILDFIESDTDQRIVYQKVSPGYIRLVDEIEGKEWKE